MLNLTIRTLFEAEQESNNNNKTTKKVDTSKMEQRFLRLLPVNIHCTIAWDTDDTCIDLHSTPLAPLLLSFQIKSNVFIVVEPDGVTNNYSNHVTAVGGFSSPDYPGCSAYSTSMLRVLSSPPLPSILILIIFVYLFIIIMKEYMIKSALPGQYQLGCNYYSNYRQDLTAGTIS